MSSGPNLELTDVGAMNRGCTCTALGCGEAGSRLHMHERVGGIRRVGEWPLQYLAGPALLPGSSTDQSVGPDALAPSCRRRRFTLAAKSS